MKKHGFNKVCDWYINSKGKLDIDFPSSRSNTNGVIAMTINEEVVFLSATKHYGPRIGDFKHSQNGESGSAKIHHLIEESIKKSKVVSIWVKDNSTPHDEKNDLLRSLNPIWNK